MHTAPQPHCGYVIREQYVVRYRETVENIVVYFKGTPTRVRNPEVFDQAAFTTRNADARP
jgi:hypothetical protein